MATSAQEFGIYRPVAFLLRRRVHARDKSESGTATGAALDDEMNVRTSQRPTRRLSMDVWRASSSEGIRRAVWSWVALTVGLYAATPAGALLSLLEDLENAGVEQVDLAVDVVR